MLDSLDPDHLLRLSRSRLFSPSSLSARAPLQSLVAALRSHSVSVVLPPPPPPPDFPTSPRIARFARISSLQLLSHPISSPPPSTPSSILNLRSEQ